ncbi:MAG TPA: tyrosine-type recombinase/integrase [Acidimicrobiales bacterium]|nr:tyrosine-type recombinase/integrase [Acidimicrobiales bacterium]
MSAPAAVAAGTAPSASELEWAEIGRHAPNLAATSARYLEQIALSLRPSSVVVADIGLRLFCHYLTEEHPRTKTFKSVGREQIEGYKVALAKRRTQQGKPVTPNLRRQRLGMLRTFFDRIIEWDWPEAPKRNPISLSDLPRPDEPLPKFLDDAQATRFARAVAAEADPLRRLVLELLMRTGMRVGELCALESDAVVQIGEGYWIRVPVGKLHNDRYVPLHPTLLPLLDDWQARHRHNSLGLLLTNCGRPLNRHAVTRMVNRAGRRAGLGHLHPHQLRHTLATQAVNRGMRLEAIAALLGHRTLRMTIRYARIANRTVRDEYQAVTKKVEALYADPVLGAEAEGPAMARIRKEHHRMLGNGWCTRPADLDCSFEAMCEGCAFFATTVEFKDRLVAQLQHAVTHRQTQRQGIYERLIDGLEEGAS